MKILILTSDFSNIPVVILDEMNRLNKSYPMCRYGEIINFVEQNAIASSYDEMNTYVNNKPNSKIYKIMDYNEGGSLYCGFNANGYIGYFKIIEIDTTKRHMIKNAHIGEEIITLPEHDCIDETANLWVERKN